VINDAPDGAILDIKVIPRAGNTAIAGQRENALLIRLAAAPVEGIANTELIELLANVLDVPKQHIILVAGLKSRTKRVKVIGLSAALVKQRLGSIVNDL
jgi:uncharacterized protein (TIGR00251 family)